MKYTVYQETTVWTEAPNTPNHRYIFDDKKRCVGYYKAGTSDRQMFSKPLVNFSSKGRTMKKLWTFEE